MSTLYMEFWENIIKRNKKYILINHNLYSIGEENIAANKKAKHGKVHYIQLLNDGKIIKSTNLDMHGKLPQHYWKKYPDTAKFTNQNTNTI